MQAGGFCVGMLALVRSTPARPGLLVVVRFRAAHRCCFLGRCFFSSEQRALGCFRFHANLVAPRVLPSGTHLGSGEKVSRKSGCNLVFCCGRHLFAHFRHHSNLLAPRVLPSGCLPLGSVNPRFVVLGARLQCRPA